MIQGRKKSRPPPRLPILDPRVSSSRAQSILLGTEHDLFRIDPCPSPRPTPLNLSLAISDARRQLRLCCTYKAWRKTRSSFVSPLCTGTRKRARSWGLGSMTPPPPPDATQTGRLRERRFRAPKDTHGYSTARLRAGPSVWPHASAE